MNKSVRVTESSEKPLNLGYVFKQLWQYLYRFKWWLFIALLLAVGSNLFALIGPYLSGKAIDTMGDGTEPVLFLELYWYCFLMALFYILSSVFTYILSVVMIKVSQNVTLSMRKDVFAKLMNLPVAYFDTHSIGDILSKLSYDIETVNVSLSSDIIQIITSIIMVIGSGILMVIISPILSVVFIITCPIAFFYTKWMTKKVKPLYRARSQKLGNLNGFVEEKITAMKTIQAYHQEENMFHIFEKYNVAACEATYQAEYYGAAMGPAVNFINNLSLSLISVFGAILYFFKMIGLGKITSFVLYSKKFSGPMNEVANIISDMQSSLAAAERIFNVLQEPVEPVDTAGALELEHCQGNIGLEHVTFGYVPDKMILHDVSFVTKPGQLFAIVGPTGAGKTTIINLLMRFYDLNGGRIFMDGVSHNEITRQSLRKSYAMVLQDTWLFEGTIYENLVYGSTKATLEDVMHACKETGIHAFIKAMPNGYQTVITENGTNISKGQKQLLTIVRAMLQDANMLILDEATSNVDTRTEIQIQNAMRSLMKHKTCFVIAHRLSTIQNADTILVVKDGDIIEQGTHESLLKQNGFYASLYQSQFESY